ncbi:4,5-dihydroxyphthalate decarboxylase [Microbacterium pygmaeum]|uniref:4,5-dihydroxyphthalate decarboxylase n=2 Tax=Microbacterium pygmaeum TaxID=370764 RepID=A0A1G7W871_9MICO|nr:4,5-dihydroxyphthalate decarboxylase [Microbacterium pygmaeum]
MTLLPLTMGAVNYDRFQAIRDGSVRVEGIDLEIVPLEVEEIFYRQMKYHEFDVSEMSMSSYLAGIDAGDFPYIALPVFPSRYFRHQSVFVRTDSGIERPEDLIGKRVGVPEYQITACVWLRGMMADDHGVTPDRVTWFSGGVDSPGRVEKRPIELPDGVTVTPIGKDETLSQLILDGSLDALFTAHLPAAFLDRPHRVTRLFPDYKAVEKAYFARTGIFPIMHVVVVRRSVLDAHPWIARSLLKAFTAALEKAKADLLYRSSLKVMLPWLADHVEETVAAMGTDYWPYGVEENRTVLDTFLRYHHSQGLSRRRREPEEIFAPSTIDEFVI